MNNRDWRGYLKSMANVKKGEVINEDDKFNHLLRWLMWTQYKIKLPDNPRGDVFTRNDLDDNQKKSIDKDLVRLRFNFIKKCLFSKIFRKCAFTIGSVVDRSNDDDIVDTKLFRLLKVFIYLILLFMAGVISGTILKLVLPLIKPTWLQVSIAIVTCVFVWLFMFGIAILMSDAIDYSRRVFNRNYSINYSVSAIDDNRANYNFKDSFPLLSYLKETVGYDKLFLLDIFSCIGYPIAQSGYIQHYAATEDCLINHYDTIEDCLINNKIVDKSKLDNFDEMVVREALVERTPNHTFSEDVINEINKYKESYSQRIMHMATVFNPEEYPNILRDIVKRVTGISYEEASEKNKLYIDYLNDIDDPISLYELNSFWLKSHRDIRNTKVDVDYVEPWNSKLSTDDYFEDKFNLEKLEKLENDVNSVLGRIGLSKEYQDKLNSYFEYQEEHSTQFARFYKTNQLLEKVYASIAEFDNKVVSYNIETIKSNAVIAIDSGMQIVKDLEKSEINRMDRILREQAYIKDDINSEDSEDE